MTPQERQLIDDLFDRLAKLESARRDPEAMSAIMQGLRNAPNAVYALVQTVLVQDEALKRADMRIQELEARRGQQNQSIRRLPRFDARRDLRAEPARTVRCPTFARPRSPAAGRPGTPGRCCSRANRPDNTISRPTPSPMAARQQQPSPFGGGGGSFLGTAAAAAVGVVGGSLLASSIRSMMGGGGNQQASATPPAIAAELKTAGRGATSPAATWRGRPGSTTSVRAAAAAATTMMAGRGRDSSIRPRMTMTTGSRFRRLRRRRW